MWLITFSVLVFTIPIGLSYGPQSAMYSEMLPSRTRLFGVSISYAIGAILGGSFAPTMAQYLVGTTGWIGSVGVYLGVMATISGVAVLTIKEPRDTPLWRHSGPPQWIVVVLGSLIAAGAVLAVVFLGSRASWPAWLAASESLSSARHTLWSDALSLWATACVSGSGPGSFTPSSELASSIASLAAVHSLPLQVGSELGAVGMVLLAVLFVGGLVFAARGSRPVALIAMVAWTALAVHSSIDHLEDFPVVAFIAGVILGWSGLGAHPPEVPQEAAAAGVRE